MDRSNSYDDEKLGSTERVEDITLLFLLNFIDRSNIGNANVAGFSKDLKLSVPKYEYNVALMLFYVAYVLVEIPSNLVMKKIGSIWLAMLTLTFAVVCISTAFVKDFGDFVGVRIALGLAEGGVIPGIAYLCTRFYTRSELSFRIGVFLSLGPGLSGAFGGLLAAGFLSATVNGLHTWQKIFVLEGVITAFFALVFFFTLPTSPESTKWLNEEERELAVTRLRIEHNGMSSDKTSFKTVLKAMRNPYTWACCLGFNAINLLPTPVLTME